VCDRVKTSATEHWRIALQSEVIQLYDGSFRRKRIRAGASIPAHGQQLHDLQPALMARTRSIASSISIITVFRSINSTSRRQSSRRYVHAQATSHRPLLCCERIPGGIRHAPYNHCFQNLFDA
jgi:hypothetical protein